MAIDLNPRPQLFSFELIFVLFLYSSVFDGIYFSSNNIPNLTMVFAILTVFTGIWVRIKDGIWTVDTDLIPIFLLFFIFIGYGLLSFFWSPSVEYAQYKLIRLVGLCSVAFVGMALITGVSSRRLKRFFVISALVSTIICGQVIYSYVISTAWRGAFLGNASYLEIGRLIGTGTLIITYLGTKYRKRWHLLSVSILLSLHFFALVISGGRAALLSSVIGMILFILVVILYNGLKITGSRTTFRYVCISSAAIPFGFYYVLNRGSQTVERLLLLFSGTGVGRSLSTRFQLYSSSIEYWMNQPWLGNGLGSFGILSGRGDVISYPHNIFFEILVEFGMVGVILFMLLIGISLARFRINQHPSPFLAALLMSYFVFWLINASFSFDLPGNRHLFTALAMLCAYDDPD